jgi:hypothetical protein
MQPVQRYLLDDQEILLGFQTASIHANMQAKIDQAAHLFQRASKAVNHAAFREFRESRPEQTLKVIGGRSHVQEQGQLQLGRDVQLRLKVFQLLVLWGHEQPVVVETDFTKRDRVPFGRRRPGQLLQRI